jgi:hypothetical protein
MGSKNAASIVCILLFGTMISCSGQKDLSRSQALELIRSSDKLKFTSAVYIETGQYVQQYAENKALYNALSSAGLVEINENPPVVAWNDVTKMVPAAERVSLTQKGTKALGLNGPTNGSWQFVTSNKIELLEVTGITKETTEPVAAVEFSWRPLPNEIGDSLLRSNLDLYGRPVQAKEQSNLPRRGGALFRRYDDGWRLQTIELE